MTHIPGTSEIKKATSVLTPPQKETFSEPIIRTITNVEELKRPKEQNLVADTKTQDSKGILLTGLGMSVFFGLCSFLYSNLIYLVPFAIVVTLIAWGIKKWAHRNLGKHDYFS